MGMPIITPSRTSRSQAITDIIESVALQEAALSHILNAEGEKLQRVVGAILVRPSELLEFNRSVEQTVRTITHLEIVLHNKLKLFENCLCHYGPALAEVETETETEAEAEAEAEAEDSEAAPDVCDE